MLELISLMNDALIEDENLAKGLKMKNMERMRADEKELAAVGQRLLAFLMVFTMLPASVLADSRHRGG